jgi:hypothetical protein
MDKDEERRRMEEEERAYWDTVDDARREKLEHREEIKRSAIERMEEWFSDQFEDPQIEMPRDSEEQVFLFPWGGPFEAADVLHSNFGHEFEEAWIMEAAERIEKDGTTEWAPTSHGDYYEAPDPDPELPEAAAALTQVILSRLDQLEVAIKELKPTSSKIGHNAPPEEIGVPPYTEEDQADIVATIRETREELQTAVPDTDRLAAFSIKFTRLGSKIGPWLAAKADLAADELIKRSIQVGTLACVVDLFEGLGDDLMRLAELLLARL